MIEVPSIGILAVSSACEPERFQRGVAMLNGAGLKINTLLDPCAAYGMEDHLFSSDRADLRANALVQLFEDPAISAIICARGAYGSLEVLPLLDYEKIRAHPKPIVGFSDVTALLLGLYSKGMKRCIHGRTVESLGRHAEKEETKVSLNKLMDALSGGLTSYEVDLRLLAGRGEAAGPIMGGNLSLITALLGTPYEPDFSGHILFIEEVGERPYRLHRMLLQLKLAGKLDGLCGILLGSFRDCAHPQSLGPDLQAVIRDIFKDFNYPVYGYISAGHSNPNLPIPFGIHAFISQKSFVLSSR